jgi:hypothetical protein
MLCSLAKLRMGSNELSSNELSYYYAHYAKMAIVDMAGCDRAILLGLYAKLSCAFLM